jgi:non-ribosomal peptide synthetase component F
MLGHFQTLLEGIALDPDRRLSALPLLSHEERNRSLMGWNATAADYPEDRSVHRLFEEQAARTPEAVALVAGPEQLTYRELDRRANRLAHHLRACGVGPDARVGVCLGRSSHLVVALLAVLKAGGAYVPLDPAYPQERLRFLLRDAQMAVLLTENRLLDGLPRGEAPTVVCLDRDLAAIAGEPDEPVRSGITTAHLAYVIYTSGSTGTPKGVGITHGNAVAFLTWARQATPAVAGARVLATTSISFDLSVYEIFGTLTWGGTVLLIESALELPERPDLQTRGAATLLNTVPSAAAALVRLGAVPPGLVRVNLAGEPVPRALVEALYAEGVGEVHDLYGPTETTTYSTAPTCWTGGWSRCRSAFRGSSIWAARAWPGGIWVGRPSPRSASCPTRSGHRPEPSQGGGCTEPATGCAGARTARSSSSAVWTSSSSCVASGSSPVKSRPCSASTPRCALPW